MTDCPDVTFYRYFILVIRFLLSILYFNLSLHFYPQSAVCSLQSAVCSLTGQNHNSVNVGNECKVCNNYIILIVVKIYNQLENTVLRICLLDRAYKLPQDIKSVEKKCICC